MRQLTTVGQRVPASLHPLATLAMRETGALGYALFGQDGRGEVHLGGGGVSISEEALKSTDPARFVSVPLGSGNASTGVIAFVFGGGGLTSEARARICSMGAAISQVWELYEGVGRVTSTAARIGELEAELADSKIASRIVGYLQSRSIGVNLVYAAVLHVRTVLANSESSRLLEERRRELEAELEEYAVAAAGVLATA